MTELLPLRFGAESALTACLDKFVICYVAHRAKPHSLQARSDSTIGDGFTTYYLDMSVEFKGKEYLSFVLFCTGTRAVRGQLNVFQRSHIVIYEGEVYKCWLWYLIRSLR